MQARETQLLTLLAGQQQFVIPIFQRDYSWGGDECEAPAQKMCSQWRTALTVQSTSLARWFGWAVGREMRCYSSDWSSTANSG